MLSLRAVTAAATCVLLLATLLPTGAAGEVLRCYSCLTKRSDRTSCNDPYTPLEAHERNCPLTYEDPVCYKIVLHNNLDSVLGDHLYSRGCVSAADFAEVARNEHETDGVRVLHASHCDHDLCNV